MLLSHKEKLLQIARSSICSGLETGKPTHIDIDDLPIELARLQATFVTLMLHHRLRGCIGTLEAYRPLAEDVAVNAFNAAFKDPRFDPLTDTEWTQTKISLSLLNPAEPIEFSSETELIKQIRPGVDGLIIEDGFHRGTFLPSVWQSLPEPNQFLHHLKRKAGLPTDYWSGNLRVSRYTVDYVSEHELFSATE